LTRLRLLIFENFARCWVRWARLPCHALAAFATDVGEQISRCTLSDLSLVVHRSSPNRLYSICLCRFEYLAMACVLTFYRSISPLLSSPMDVLQLRWLRPRF
jgi:hypothetical protein